MYENDVASALRGLERTGVLCDFCFLDPPYTMRGAYERTLEFLGESRMVGPSTIVIAEHEKKFDLGETFGTLVRYQKTHSRGCCTESLPIIQQSVKIAGREVHLN